MAQTNVYDKLKELGIELPSAGAPAAAYVMSAQSGNTVYLSGHIAKKDGKVWAGKLGATLTTEEGKAASSHNNLRHGFRPQSVLVPATTPPSTTPSSPTSPIPRPPSSSAPQRVIMSTPAFAAQ